MGAWLGTALGCGCRPGNNGGIGIPIIDVGSGGKLLGKLGKLVGSVNGGRPNPPGDEDATVPGAADPVDDGAGVPRAGEPAAPRVPLFECVRVPAFGVGFNAGVFGKFGRSSTSVASDGAKPLDEFVGALGSVDNAAG